MHFEDQGLILSVKPFGETGALVHILCEGHGVYAGHVSGGASRKAKIWLQPGNSVEVTYRARLDEQLGAFSLEPTINRAGRLLDDPDALLGLSCATHMTRQILPEREAFVGVYYGLDALLGHLGQAELWPLLYVRFELGLLEAVGFGLDLTACAVSGERDNLCYVSPRSGRAVSRREGEPYKDKLLPLPSFLLASQAGYDSGDAQKGLKLTGYFLQKRIFDALNRPLPEARTRLEALFHRICA